MGLKKNLTYSAILTFSTYLVPLIVFPYISRILGPAGIGTVDTVEYIINYCVLCSMMGLPILGIREIARSRDNHIILSNVFSSLFVLNLIVTFFIVSFLVLLVFIVPDFYARREFFYIGILKIFANVFWIEWFYKGVEDFKYITIRSLIVRVAFVVSVFVFINTTSDNILYYLLFVFITIVNAICNWCHKGKYVKFSFKAINLKSVFRPYFMLGLFALLSAVYTNLNISFLGFICNEEEVGYYTTATRIYTVVIALMSTLTGVMIPRMSVLVAERKFDDIKTLVNKVFNLLFLFGLPVIIYVLFYASDLIALFAGDAFQSAVLPMRIVIFLVLIIGTEQIFMMQLLIPMRKDGLVALCAMCGAIVCLVFNIVFVADLKSVGSALAWVVSESVVLLLSSIAVKKYFRLSFPFKMFFSHLFISIPYIGLGFLFLFLGNNLGVRLFASAILFFAYFIYVEEKMINVRLISGLLNNLKSVRNIKD